MDPNLYQRGYAIGQDGTVNSTRGVYVAANGGPYPNGNVMNHHLPYNPWEVNYTATSPHTPLKPTFPVGRFHPSYRHTPPVAFPLFPLLPAELRIRIWSFAAPYKRAVEIRSWGSNPYAPIKYSVHPHYLPAIFHVCRESRTEARRIYKRYAIGVSAGIKIPGQRYVDWECHPANPYAKRRARTGGLLTMPVATPLPPAYVYLSWEHDVIYLGPEFQHRHLLKFLTTEGDGKELRDLRYLALDRKLWCGNVWRQEMLREALYGLKTRESLSEVIVVPDDEEGCLVDRWYYGKHDISLCRLEMHDIPFRVLDWEHTLVANLQEWFKRMWKHQKMQKDDAQTDAVEDESCNTKRDVSASQASGGNPPWVSVMSLKRNGNVMRDYAAGLFDIKNSMEDMRSWKIWTPPVSS